MEDFELPAAKSPTLSRSGLRLGQIRRGDAAIDEELGARHPFGLIAGEVERGVGDVPGLAEAAGGDVVEPIDPL